MCQGTERDNNNYGETTSAARSEIRRGDQAEGVRVNTMVGAARRPTKGRA
jgi:hypothetical protein